MSRARSIPVNYLLPKVRYTPDTCPDATPQEISNLVAAWPLFASVYQLGYAQGQESMSLTTEQAADAAARKFYAMEEFDIENRRRTQLDRGWFDVQRHRDQTRRAA